MRWLLLTALVVFANLPFRDTLDNGLALTPPMGWLTWERFRCNMDCENDPDNCISENLIKTMADHMAADGYRDAGYYYVIIDDCWLEKERDANGQLQADRKRFSQGIKALADYVHSKGLGLGIYQDYGTKTCAGYPGLLGHLEMDAQTFADWEVDYIKVDGCNVGDVHDFDEGYPEFGHYLNKTGRPMVYSCEWPFYQIVDAKLTPNFTAIAQTCNLWRNYEDVQDSWESVTSILDFHGNEQDMLVPHAHPGAWNDPDMLIIGNFGLSYEQSKAQMTLWAIMASPLLMSVDLRTIKQDYKDILLNKQVLQVNQDILGIQGKRVYQKDKIEIWVRPISPKAGKYFSYAIAYLNRRTDGTPSEVAVALKNLGLTYKKGYRVTELFSGKNFDVLTPDTVFRANVNPTGVMLVRADVVKA